MDLLVPLIIDGSKSNISANRNEIESIPRSNASLADLDFKCMKANPKFWKELSFCRNLSKNPDYDATKQTLNGDTSPTYF